MPRLRNMLPKGLYWRTILIILVPAAIVQLLITMIFLDDHWRFTSKRMSQGTASDVALLIQLYERSPTPATFADLRQLAAYPLRLDISIDTSGPLRHRHCGHSASAIIDHYMIDALTEALDRPVWYDPTCPGDTVIIRAPIREGVLEVHAFRDRVQARSGPLFVMWIFGATLFLCLVSVLFIRNQVRPIIKLADAMERFGRGEDGGVFRVRGAREVRGATHAFFDMRARIRRQIEQRAQLLAGVSHDLRTPLTRLKLQFALMTSTPELEDAKRDLADMEETLEEYLAFARGMAEEAPSLVDVARLAEEASRETARHGASVSFSAAGETSAPIRPRAVKRCLANLIDNAAAHGETIEVRARGEAGAVFVTVEDDGPGIPEEQYEEAFRPFSRLDATRSRNQKGVGLGLAIARDVARGHGGEVTLSRAPLGGLRATLRLPKSS
jgi:two-component system, OmpR family, osmolarity sensor histidine kinase EnvZ